MGILHWQYLLALGGVVGVGWLIVVPMYRGWGHLNERMADHVTMSSRLIADHRTTFHAELRDDAQRHIDVR